MNTLTLKIPDIHDYELLVKLFQRLGVQITQAEEPKKQKTMKGLYSLVESVGKNELFKEIKNPVAWQKKLRNEWR